MHSPSEHTTLLLERAGDGACLPDDVSPIGPFRQDDRGPGPEQLVARSTGQDQLLASPGMALLAAVSILEGYKWLGAIPAGDSRLSALVFGRGGALVFTALATVAAVVLTRADPGGPRTLPQRLVLAATTALIASSAVLLAGTGTLARDLIGVSDLALASALAGTLFAGERRRRASRRDGPLRGDSADRALPVV